jgi:YD repeat-containing protein
MISGAGRTITYDYDNRPTSITYNGMATISVYDAYGNRVKKITLHQ